MKSCWSVDNFTSFKSGFKIWLWEADQLGCFQDGDLVNSHKSSINKLPGQSEGPSLNYELFLHTGCSATCRSFQEMIFASQQPRERTAIVWWNVEGGEVLGATKAKFDFYWLWHKFIIWYSQSHLLCLTFISYSLNEMLGCLVTQSTFWDFHVLKYKF